MFFGKIDGIKSTLEIFERKLVLCFKDDFLLAGKMSGKKISIRYEQIYKIDFETAGKFTNGYLHLILKEDVKKNVFEDRQQEDCIFLFDFMKNDQMIELKNEITKKINDKLSDETSDTKNIIKELTNLKELHQNGALTKKQYDQQIKNLVKKITN